MILKNKQGGAGGQGRLVKPSPETMGDRVHKHRIGRYVFEFPGGKGDCTAIRNCIKENSSLDRTQASGGPWVRSGPDVQQGPGDFGIRRVGGWSGSR